MHPVGALAPDLPALQELYDSGLYVSAWKRAQALSPFIEWRDSAGCTFAARLLGNLGAPRLSQFLHARAWRADRADPLAAYFRASVIYGNLGPLRALRFLEKLPAFPGADAETRASMLGLRMRIFSRFKDSTRAEKLWTEALAVAPGHPWLWVERAYSLESLDAYSDALAAGQRALALQANYRPAVQCVAHLLGLNQRDDEALELLRAAAGALESPNVVAQYAALLAEHDRHEEALPQWKRYRELSVASEPADLAWWHARMSDTYYELGQLTKAGEHARLAKNGFHEQIAERLLHPPAEARVVRLQVPFVRQHDMTCAPATLSALSRYWQIPVDHLQLAREICYDGTQPFRERQWAEQHGFLVREFSVSWETAVTLLDRGIPFALGTVETFSAHIQAVMGYDGVRGTLIVRDSYLKHPSEFIGPKWLESYASSGPRGFVVLPSAEAARLEGLTLPDAELYDRYHALSAALHVHDRECAEQALTALELCAPDHRITWEARRELAWYDSNQPKVLAATEALLAKFPESNRLRWARYRAVEDLSRHADRRALLAELARSKTAEPLFWREFGNQLRLDARQLPAARRWLLRALRYQPTDADHLHAMAGILWEARRLADALALYRLAATLRDKAEHLQQSWFIAARHLKVEGEVLAVLQQRAEREAKHSSLPARTLFWALTALGRDHEALAALNGAILARPDDGSLLCFAADAFARYGENERAGVLLAQAEKRTTRLEWLCTAARLADYRPDLAEALRLYRLAAPEDPLDVTLHTTIARLLAETQGEAAAVAYLREQIAAFPHHLGFREAFIRWSRGQGAECCEAPLRQLIELSPENVWALRELALVLMELNRMGEALEWCDKAVALTPHDESSHGIRATVLLRAGRDDEAAEAARTALRLSVDYTAGFATLLEAAHSFGEKQAALAFILAELKRQTVFGGGLLEYLSYAFRVLEPEDLLANLRDAHQTRPDLWHAWAALITHLCDMQRADEALPLAEAAVERFPLSARLWSDLARVQRERREFPAEIEAFQRAVALSPSWGFVSRQLSSALQRVDRYDDAQIVLEEAIAAAPLEPQNYVELSHLLWRRNRNPRANELLTQAIRLSPNHSEAWNSLRDHLAPDTQTAVALARSIADMRGGETGPWLRLAEILPDDAVADRLAALDRALVLDPRNEEAHDMRASVLAEAGRYDEAMAECDPPAFGGLAPRSLRGRAAWIIARRGNIRAAREQMRQLAAAEPDYYWAWERIAQWSDELGDHATERDAAEKMSRLSPRSPVPLGYLADAMMKLGKPDDATKVLQRAFELDPSYGYAGFSIFREQLRQRDFAGAAQTLCQLQLHLPGPDAAAAAVRLAAAKRDKATALAAFQQILSVPARDAYVLGAAVPALIEAGWAVDFERIIWERRDDPEMNPAAAAHWVHSFMQRECWRHSRKVLRLAPTTPFAQAAMRELASMCGDKKRVEILRKLVRKHRDWLHADAEAWGAVGYAWLACGRRRELLRWFGEWRTRSGVQPWMLHNLAITLDELGREEETIEAHRRALSLPRDHTAAAHLTHLSILEALRGDLSSAKARVAEVDYESLQPHQQAEWAMVRLLHELGDAPPARRPEIYKSERPRFYTDHPLVHTKPQLKRRLRAFEQALADTAGVRRSRPIKVKFAKQESHVVTIFWIIVIALWILARCSRIL